MIYVQMKVKIFKAIIEDYEIDKMLQKIPWACISFWKWIVIISDKDFDHSKLKKKWMFENWTFQYKDSECWASLFCKRIASQKDKLLNLSQYYIENKSLLEHFANKENKRTFIYNFIRSFFMDLLSIFDFKKSKLNHSNSALK